jgi:hypothetical protein
MRPTQRQDPELGSPDGLDAAVPIRDRDVTAPADAAGLIDQPTYQVTTVPNTTP